MKNTLTQLVEKGHEDDGCESGTLPVRSDEAGMNELEGEGAEDRGAALGTDESRPMPQHVKDAISLAGFGIDDKSILDEFDMG